MAIPPLYNPANYGRFSVWFLSPGGSYPPVSTVVFTSFGPNFDYIKLNTPFLHTRGINILCRISCKYLNFQRGITATPVALGSMMKCILCNPLFISVTSQKILPVTFQVDVKKLIQSKHHADPHNPQPANHHFFPQKRDSFFLLIDHPAHPIGHGGSNQRELLASADSPSPCASLATLFKTDKSKTYTFTFGGNKKLKLDRPSPKKWSIRDNAISSFVHTDKQIKPYCPTDKHSTC